MYKRSQVNTQEFDKSSGKKQAGAMVALTEMVPLEVVDVLRKRYPCRNKVHRPLAMRRWLGGTPRLLDFDLLLSPNHLLRPQRLATDAEIST